MGPSRRSARADRRTRRRLADVVLERLGERSTIDLGPAHGRPGHRSGADDPVRRTPPTQIVPRLHALRAAYATWDDVLAAPTDKLDESTTCAWTDEVASHRTCLRRCTPPPTAPGRWAPGPMPRWMRATADVAARHRAQDRRSVLLFNFGVRQLPSTPRSQRRSRLVMLPPRTPLVRAPDLLEEVLEPRRLSVPTLAHPTRP